LATPPIAVQTQTIDIDALTGRAFLMDIIFYRHCIPTRCGFFVIFLFIILVSLIDLDQTNLRLRTNNCALSSRWISRHAPLFPYQNASLPKGIRAQHEKLMATKGAIVGTQAQVGLFHTNDWHGNNK
jgi:hypothetical protein